MSVFNRIQKKEHPTLFDRLAVITTSTSLFLLIKNSHHLSGQLASLAQLSAEILTIASVLGAIATPFFKESATSIEAANAVALLWLGLVEE